MEEEEERQPKDYKIFVDNCHQYVGSAVSLFLANKGFTVYGYGESFPSDRIIKVDSRKEGILSTELSVFDMTEETSSVEEALEIVNSNPLHKKVQLCIFSPLLTWGGRSLKPPKEEEEEEDKKDEGGKDEEEMKEVPKEEEEENGEEEDVETEPFDPINEDDYLSRIPHEVAEEQYRLESRALQLNQELERLTVTIFGVGLLYGRGDNILFPFFRALWENKTDTFPQSKNHISCIHVMNLGFAIAQILQSPPDPEERKPYYILGEETSPSLRAIGKAFSGVLSDGKVSELVDDIPEFHKAILLTELAAESSFIAEEEELYCQAGIIESAAKVVDEFREKYHLEPLKVLVVGPPASGYDIVAKEISMKLGMPLIIPGDTVNVFKEENSEFGDEIRGMLEENEGQVSDEVICKCVHRRVAAKDCRNYGWVISGFADTLDKAGQIFDAGEEEMPSPHFEHIPTHVVVLDSDDKTLEIEAAKTSNDSETFKKRLRRYRRKNGGDENLYNFFDDRAIPSIIIPAFKDISEVFEFLGPKRDFGRPQEEIDAEIAAAKAAEEERIAEEKRQRDEQLGGEEKTWKDGESIHESVVQRMEAQDTAYLAEKSDVLKKYLDEEVINHVIKGVVKVAKDMPPDPVDALAAFLFAENRRLKQ